MKVSLARRVEMGLGTLTPTERDQIQASFKKIGQQTLDEFRQNSKVHQFTARSGRHLYTYPGNSEFQIILSLQDDACLVEDLAPDDFLRGLLAKHDPPVFI